MFRNYLLVAVCSLVRHRLYAPGIKVDLVMKGAFKPRLGQRILAEVVDV